MGPVSWRACRLSPPPEGADRAAAGRGEAAPPSLWMEPVRSGVASLMEHCDGYPGCLFSPAAAVGIQMRVCMWRLSGYKSVRIT